MRQVERAQALDFAEYNVLKDSAEAKLDELMRRLEGCASSGNCARRAA